jgi:Protein of unknown function (DUF3592)
LRPRSDKHSAVFTHEFKKPNKSCRSTGHNLRNFISFSLSIAPVSAHLTLAKKMDSSLVLVIAFIATLLGGMAIGFMCGITKGMSLGATFRTRRPVSPIPWILCFIGAGIFLLTAVGSSIYSIYFLSSSIQTKGLVTEIVERKDDEGHISRTPVYTYKDSSGEDFTDRSSTGDGREFEVGDTIPIRYLKTSPHQSRIDYFSHHWLLPLFMAVSSILLGGLGFGLRWWRDREQQWANKTLHPTAGNVPV